MPRFSVRYLAPDRTVRTALVDANEARGIPAALQVPVHHVLTSVLASAANGSQAWASSKAAFPLRLFSQELSVLLDAGIPLLEALITLREKEAVPRVAAALDDVIAALREGQPLSTGLRQRPEAFTDLFIATVEASERTGQLPTALRQHAAYLAWAETLRSRLVSAAIYPAMLLVAGGAVLVFLLLFVVPRFAGLLEGFQGDLPWASKALLAAGGLGSQHPWAVVVAAMLMLAAPIVAWQQQPVREVVVRWTWRWPVIGAKLRLLELAKLYRTAGMLLAAGVPVVPSLQTCQPLMNGSLRTALTNATADVRSGARLSASLDQHGLCTPVSLRMVRVGERSGELGAMLERAAAFYDEELVRLAELVTRVINPLLMLVMGVVIGSVVVLMYLPIFQLAEQVQ